MNTVRWMWLSISLSRVWLFQIALQLSIPVCKSAQQSACSQHCFCWGLHGLLSVSLNVRGQQNVWFPFVSIQHQAVTKCPQSRTHAWGCIHCNQPRPRASLSPNQAPDKSCFTKSKQQILGSFSWVGCWIQLMTHLPATKSEKLLALLALQGPLQKQWGRGVLQKS